MTRNGKIARLPKDIRHELNTRLDNGQQAEPILRWLNARELVREILEEDFDGRPITKQNLSEWKNGGFLDWQRNLERCDRVRGLVNAAEEIDSAAGDLELPDRLASVLVAELAEATRQLLETTTDPGSGAVADPKMFNLYMRYRTTHTRAFHKSLNDLLKLRKETRTQLNGFEAQKRAEALLNLKLEKHEMKKQGHYWDVLLKDAKAMHQLTINLNAHSVAARENPGFQAQFEGELAELGLKEDRGPVDVARAAF